ncbi:hypothetical protein BDR07DRAFT_1378827 [Suillus spraguei]|nr:hypothetical protein BDR07DRAFT_1378827 [Suillus spraguei]
MVKYANWAKALGNLRCMLRVVLMDLETVAMSDNNKMSEADILALNRAVLGSVFGCMTTSVMHFDLNHIFGVALHDKVMSIIVKLMRQQVDCLPLANNGLVWFICHQITRELIYHMVFWHNTMPGHCICLADLDPVAFKHTAHPPVATLALVVTSISTFTLHCYKVLMDLLSNKVKNSHEFLYPSEMHTQICKMLPALFSQTDDPNHAPLMVAMNVLCTIKKGNVQQISWPKCKAKKKEWLLE